MTPMRAKPLLLAWLVLVALTGVAGFSADLIGRNAFGALPVLAVSAVTLAKVRLILLRYLKLGAQPALLTGFIMAAAVIVAIVTAGLFVTL